MKDLTGQQFGRLIARRPTEKRSGTSVVWECICECGETAFVKSQHLCTGRIRSCGCLRKDFLEDLIAEKEMVGQRFGLLTVIAMSKERKNGGSLWECACDCGNMVLVSRNNLKKRCDEILRVSAQRDYESAGA